MEDESGNKILVDENGKPLLSTDGRPVIISSGILEDMGVNLGEPVEVKGEDFDVLTMMVKGLTKEEANAEVLKQKSENAFLN